VSATAQAPAAPVERPADRIPAPRRRRLAGVVRQLVLLAAAVVMLYPVFFMATTAFKTQGQYLDSPYALPWPLSVDNFSQAVRGGAFFTWFKNSMILTLGSVIISTAAAALAAFAIARMRFRGRDVLLSISTALMVVPPVVMLLPLFILFVNLELVDTYLGAILIYSGLTLPFSIYMLTNFFRAIPHELVESALTDGAKPRFILLRIILPLSMPALVTLVVVNSLWVWNELLIALVFLPDDKYKTLMVGVTVFRSKYNLDVPVTMAGMLLASVPMLLLYLFGQRFFIRGLTAGAVKG
jgi:ABC-type glycerol-3-phosphate transport system permease component